DFLKGGGGFFDGCRFLLGTFCQLVARTRNHAEHSGQVVRDAIGEMDQIENSSREISNIIGVIDEIDFQTNLLALNAGVEA
ncbi:methyl-accepting chemotaxis protein, partial [Rhizobium ruizarguesonis]